jgi:PAS domain S-box-containing protein
MENGGTMLDHIDGVVIHVEANTLRPIAANAALRTLVGEAPELWSARAESWQQLFDSEDWPRVARLCRAVARDGRRRRLEHLVRIQGRRPRWFRTSLGRVNENQGARILVAHMLEVGDESSHEIAAQQAWTREILRQAPLAFFVLDRRGVVRLAEGKGLDRLGVQPGGMVGRSMLYGPWHWPWISENARRVLRGDQFSEIASVGNGWLSIRYLPLHGRQGQVRGALGFVTDISECKHAVDLIETIDAVLWQAHGPQLQLCFAGGSSEKLFGDATTDWLEHPEFLERHLLSTEREAFQAALQAVVDEGAERTIVHKIRRGDGSERLCRTTMRPLTDPAGHRDVVGLTLDITDRKAAEQAVPLPDPRWRLLAEQAPVIIYTVDRELHLTTAVGAGLTALGLRGDGSLIGQSLERYFRAAADAGQPLIEAHRKALDGQRVRIDSQWLGRAYQLLLDPLRDDAGAIVGVVAVAVDVTERFEHERESEQLLLAEKAAHAAAEQAVRVRDQFLSVASHELRTPLGALMLGLQATLRRLNEGALSKASIHKLEVAERQAQRLNTLIGQLLDASRLAAGRELELQREPVELGELVREIAERFEPELERTGTELQVQAPAPLCGQWDRSRMDQLITNLVSNAIKYGNSKPVQIALDQPEPGKARITVTDRGIGIPPRDIPFIFSPFYRVADKHTYSGLGLGLYIVAEIVKGHGGEIRVDSEPGQGTALIVELPGAQPP